MTKDGPGFDAILVADHRGHIIERVCASWLKHGSLVRHAVAISDGTDNYELSKLGRHARVLFWVDQVRFGTCGHSICQPQVLMIHHVTQGTERQTYLAACRADVLAAPCRQWQRAVQSSTGRRVHLIPYSIDTEVFRPSPARGAIRAAKGISPDEFVLGLVGKASADHLGRKGIGLFMEVANAAHARWRNLVIALVGPGWNPLADGLREHGLKVIRFQFDSCNETPLAYATLDALIVTAREEGGPCTVLEAMATEVAVISSPVGLVPDLITDGATGFVCSSGAVAEYIDAIEVLQTNPHRARCIRVDARRLVHAERRDEVIVPRINFRAIYNEAEESYKTRRRSEIATRALSRGYMLARHFARRRWATQKRGMAVKSVAHL